MLFLVESFPQPAHAEAVADRRTEGRRWLGDLRSRGLVHVAYNKPGRGMFVVFCVGSVEELHELLTEWTTYIPCTFSTTPLLELSAERMPECSR